VNVPVMVDDPGAATVALVPDNETTLVFDDEYDHDPSIDGETVGAVNVNDASPYVLDTSLHVKVGVCLAIVIVWFAESADA